jgi:hypothetical protein
LKIDPLAFLPPTLLVIAVTASLWSGRTLSLWPIDGRILDRRVSEPRQYWLSVGFYTLMSAVSFCGALFLRAEPLARSSAVELTPGMMGAIVIVPLGLNVVYYWMKSKEVDKSAWRRFWFIGWVLMLTIGICPELLSLRLPSPLWKVALIPVVALLFSSFNVAVSGLTGGAKKS